MRNKVDRVLPLTLREIFYLGKQVAIRKPCYMREQICIHVSLIT